MYIPVNKLTQGTFWQDAASDIAGQIAEEAALHDENESFVEAGFALLKQAGFFKALVPSELGGGGATVETICECIRILARACGSTALAFAMHSHVVAAAAWRREHQDAPTEGLLRRVAAEDLVLVSSGGNDWLESGGTAKKVEGGYVISGRKPFASGSPVGDLLVTSAIEELEGGGRTVLHFAIPLRAQGVEHKPTWHVLGMRGTGSNDIVIDGLFVPDSAISGRRPVGEWHMLFHVICKIAFALIYAAYLGLAEAARDKAVSIAAKRSPDPLVAQLAGEMENELLCAQLAHERAIQIAELWEPGPETTSAASACRRLTGHHAIETVTKAMELAGGQSFYRQAGIERIFRDVQAGRFHPLQGKQQLDFTGRNALGWPI
jgi:alkylation response protein AidB-like acyl-CoA dehydrogenase